MQNLRYRSVQHKCVDLGFGRFLIHVSGTAKRVIVSSDENEVLQQCNRTDTLTSHLNRICEARNTEVSRRPGVAAILRNLLEKGLLITKTEPMSAGDKGLNRRISTLALVTADRPATMERALASYWENFQSYDRDPAILVMDDSKSDQARSRYIQSLMRQGHGNHLKYAGRREKLRFVEELAAQGIDSSVAGFALLGVVVPGVVTTGANRNCVLLELTGEFLLMADDDTVCTVVPHPQRQDKLKLGNHSSPREISFYRTREEVVALAKGQKYDLLKEYESLLGRSLFEILAQSPEICTDSDEACEHLLMAAAGNAARVVLTMPGVAGDSGARYAQRFLSSSPKTLAQLNESEATSQLAFSSREVLWVAPGRTINHSSHCQAGGLGIANDEFLPPFLPIGRNQDGVFGVLNMLGQNSFFGHLPFALLHDAERDRKYQSLPALDVSELVISLVHFVLRRHYSGLESALCSTGKDLLEIGRLDDHEFWELLFTAVSENAARAMRLLDLSRKTLDHCTNFIQREIDRYREHVFASLTAVPCCIPVEFAALPVEVAREETRKLIHRTAQLFCTWPDLVRAAQYLRAKGLRLARDVGDVCE